MTPSEADKGKTLYRLKFVPDALKEWQTLDGSIKEPLRKLLKKRLEKPHMPGAELHGDLRGCYKIKLRKQGYRLVYSFLANVSRRDLFDDFYRFSACVAVGIYFLNSGWLS